MGAKPDKEEGEHPEIDRRPRIREHPGFIQKGGPVSFNDIIHGVDLENPTIALWNGVDRPDDRRQPEPGIEHNGQSLSNVFVKNVNGGNQPAESNAQNKQTADEIENLNGVN